MGWMFQHTDEAVVDLGMGNKITSVLFVAFCDWRRGKKVNLNAYLRSSQQHPTGNGHCFDFMTLLRWSIQIMALKKNVCPWKKRKKHAIKSMPCVLLTEALACVAERHTQVWIQPKKIVSPEYVPWRFAELGGLSFWWQCYGGLL